MKESKLNNIFSAIIGALLSVFFLSIVLKRLVSKRSDDDSSKVGIKDKMELAKRVYSFRKNRKATPKGKGDRKLKSTDLRKYTDREEKILQLFTTHHMLGMEEIKPIFKDVDVRTIRRDLSHLLKLGLIIKQGKTRGSKYSKA